VAKLTLSHAGTAASASFQATGIDALPVQKRLEIFPEDTKGSRPKENCSSGLCGAAT